MPFGSRVCVRSHTHARLSAGTAPPSCCTAPCATDRQWTRGADGAGLDGRSVGVRPWAALLALLRCSCALRPLLTSCPSLRAQVRGRDVGRGDVVGAAAAWRERHRPAGQGAPWRTCSPRCAAHTVVAVAPRSTRCWGARWRVKLRGCRARRTLGVWLSTRPRPRAWPARSRAARRWGCSWWPRCCGSAALTGSARRPQPAATGSPTRPRRCPGRSCGNAACKRQREGGDGAGGDGGGKGVSTSQRRATSNM